MSVITCLDPLFRATILNSIENLPRWGLIIVYSTEVELFVRQTLSDIYGVVDSFVASFPDRYNNLILSSAFWQLVPSDKVLSCQSNSVILSGRINEIYGL